METKETKKAGSTDDVQFTTSISEGQSWIASIRRQLRELAEDRRNPRPKPQITAAADPEALRKFIETPGPVASLLAQLRSIANDWRNPHRIELTAQPVEVQEIWSKQTMSVPGMISVGLHVVVLLLALFIGARELQQQLNGNVTSVTLYTPDPALILRLQADQAGGGGGGGRQLPTPPSQGRLPKPADKQLAPPDPEPKNPEPELKVEPTIVAPNLADLPRLNLPQLGDPGALPGPPSSGPGAGSGIGAGRGRGVGEGAGPGAGPGEGGGAGGGVFRVGGGVSAPAVVYRVEPQYSEEARKARYQGTVVLEAIVRRDGTVEILRVVRSLGFGLDENAIQALRQWRFRPGMRNGAPVDVALNIEVNFNLR